jgi:predicted secreted hydrolase
MRKILALTSLILAFTLLAGGAYALTRPGEDGQVEARLAVAEALGGEPAAGYARAVEQRPFTFPADHGPHPEFRTEWWYYTGNLATADGRRFGFQLTFFRTALSPEAPQRASAWGANQVYMAHFAISDVAGRRFYAFDRFSRGALDLAGARAEPFRVWLEDWSTESAGSGALPMRLRAAQGEVGLELVVDSAKPTVLQGERGLSRKGAEPGNASYYYSYTRMPASGSVRVGSQTFVVEGLAWMDREWSTSALGDDLAGWDWFALQLEDGREVMYYQLRRKDGGIDPFSGGTFVAADGTSRSLAAGEVELAVSETWPSPRDGTRYPARWRLRIPGEGLDLEIVPHLADQELNLAVRYWEGAVGVTGTAAGRPVAGNGYVELTGYADLPGARQ